MAKRDPKKKLLLLSDNRDLARAIESILDGQVQVWSFIVEPRGSSESFVAPRHLDLIIMALSEDASEPVVALARASLGHMLNQVPMLIVSNKSFQPHTDAKIAYMEFPFAADQLQKRVGEILKGNLLGNSILRRFKVKRSYSIPITTLPIKSN